MALEQVIGEVRRDAEARAQAIIAEARKQAEAIHAAAKAEAQQLEQKRLADADNEATQIRAQAASRAESEARRALLTTEATLRSSLREATLEAFAKLDGKVRADHLKKILAAAKDTIPAGRVWGAEADEKALKAQKTYAYAGATSIVGGAIVESEDGQVRLDLSYETLLDDAWRDVLKAEAGLFR